MPPLILIHGALGGADQLLGLREALVARRATDGDDPSKAPVHIHEIAGHGRTPPRSAGGGGTDGGEVGGTEGSREESGFSIETMAEELAAAIDARGWSGVDVFGYSMGGYVALHLARTQPARIGRIVTVGTKLAWDPATAEHETGLLDPDKIAAKVPRFAQILAERHGAERWPVLCRETAALLRALGDRPLLDETAFGEIEQPVCIGVGDRDGTVSLEECASAYRALPQGALAVLPRTPHPLERVSTHELATLITGFFTGDRIEQL